MPDINQVIKYLERRSTEAIASDKPEIKAMIKFISINEVVAVLEIYRDNEFDQFMEKCAEMGMEEAVFD